MTNDVVQVLIVLVSVITGGLITYLTTRSIENQKWKQQKIDKQQDRYREALELALKWIEPIDFALSRIKSLSSAFINGRVTAGELRKQWPNLLRDLSMINRTIPARLKVLLPSTLFQPGFLLIEKIDDLYIYLTLYSDTHQRLDLEPLSEPPSLVEKLNVVSRHLEEIRKLTDYHQVLLIEEYKNTYK